MANVGFVGAGTVGTALAVRLRGKGYIVAAVASRTRASADRLAGMVEGCRVYNTAQEVADAADLVFITTPDGIIPEIAAQVKWHPKQGVVHCSGADSLDILAPATKHDAMRGGFHPLQTFATVAYAIENIPGSTFALEADEPLLGSLKEMAAALGGHWIVLKPGDKVVYHAAAVLSCNYMITLVKLATDLWKTFGVSTPEATQALLPLMRGTLNNLNNVGLPNSLTGPIARGDTGTVQKHLVALHEKAPDLLPAYEELGRQTIPIALAKGKIDRDKANELNAILSHPGR
ncbi:MAG: DUF2520 domain-containing protein [Dehalococcoidia bacterium]|nr:DUF2520 domain-containing protein [Dehalococcoidia bacterium]